jgi:hypothetical protein
MVAWGRAGLMPTIDLPRCREGVDDLRFAVTLWNLATRKADHPAAKEALAWLQGLADGLKVGQQDRPAETIADEEFRRGCIARIKALNGG